MFILSAALGGGVTASKAGGGIGGVYSEEEGFCNPAVKLPAKTPHSGEIGKQKRL